MNTSKVTLPVVAVFLTAVLTACSNTGGYGAASTGDGYGNKSKAKIAEAEQVREAKTVTVNIKDFAFAPATITISAGDTVVFVNEDTAPHTATANSGKFNTDQLAAGESGSVTISDAGSYEYFCAIHPAMKGTVVVE